MPPLSSALLVTLQVLLVQMHSFSANNYCDYKAWGEENYVQAVSEQGLSNAVIVFYILAPLLALGCTWPFSSHWFLLLLVYIVLYAIFHLPGTRTIFKEHYMPAIFINSICLGTIIFLYPYLAINNTPTLTATTFSIIFFFYLAFYEVLHQIEHLGKDKIYSLPQATSIRVSGAVGKTFLICAMAVAAAALITDPAQHFVFTGTLIFSSARLYRMRKLAPEQASYKKLRDRPDKFYSLQEGIYYVIVLLARRIA